MIVNGKHFESLWWDIKTPDCVYIIDQRLLPFRFITEELKSTEDVFVAIKDMHLRGAPLIGAAAAWGMYLAILNSPKRSTLEYINDVADYLKSSRPTAINLTYAIERSFIEISPHHSRNERINAALNSAIRFTAEEKEASRRIGQFGLPLIEKISKQKKKKEMSI